MRIELSSPFRKGAFLAGCAVLSIAAWLACSQMAVAYWLASADTPGRLARAARLQPLNAEYEERLGILHLQPGYADFNMAVVHLEKAAAVNPHSSSIWMSLAQAYEVVSNTRGREESIGHAIVAEPKDTQVQWAAANLIVESDPARSLRLLRGVVENDPQYTLPAMSIALHAANNDVDRALQAIPQTTAARLQLVHWFTDHDQPEVADGIWPSLLTASGPLKVTDAFFYLDSLIARHHAAQAHAAWTALLDRDPKTRAQAHSSNLVFNGDFEDTLLNGGLAWHFTPTAGVSASLDTTQFHFGTRSMALQIDAQDLRDSGLSQLIAVDPNTHYSFSGWLHAEELEAAHGMRVAITDAYTGSEVMISDDCVGSFPWREIDGDFVTSADTQMLKLAIVRSPSNGRIRGRLWVDDLRIEKK
jgi:Carbohydrate binding domain